MCTSILINTTTWRDHGWDDLLGSGENNSSIFSTTGMPIAILRWSTISGIGFSVRIRASMRKGRFSLSWPPDLAHLRFLFGHCQAIRTHRLAGGGSIIKRTVTHRILPRREEPALYPADHDRQTARPLARSRRRWIRNIGRAMPSLRHASSDSFSSRSTLHIRIVAPQPATERVRRPPESEACLSAGSAGPRSAAATRRRPGEMPHGRERAR